LASAGVAVTDEKNALAIPFYTVVHIQIHSTIVDDTSRLVEREGAERYHQWRGEEAQFPFIEGHMKTIAAILLLSCWALGQDKAAVAAAEAACGPRDVSFEVKADVSQHPTPAPESGKALVYVVQEDRISSRFGVDGKWVGANNRRSYFFVQIDPGEHHLCAIARLGAVHWVSVHQFKAEADKTYYFVPHIEGGAVYAVDSKFDLSQVDPDEGRDLVAKAKFCTSHPK
jgi:hypothetical protein